MTSSFLVIADAVLRREGHPLSARQIIEVAEREQMLPDHLSGKTPHQTLKSKLSVAIRTEGTDCRFVRAAPGRFALRDQIATEAVYQAPRYLPPASSEYVLGFPASRLDAVGRFDGIKTSHKRVLQALLLPGVDAVERVEAETRDDFKQLITYILVTRGSDVLAFKRGAFNRVEHFLRSSHCVGFGGHVNAADLNLLTEGDGGLSRCVARELSEELSLPDVDARRVANGGGLRIRGLLNDDSSPAGRRHFAVVYQYEVSDSPTWDEPSRGEKAITQLRWLRRRDSVRLNDFEYWSQLCLRSFRRGVLDARPQIRARRIKPFHPPHLLCIVGQIGSGKSEAADLLCEVRGYEAVNSGAIVARILKMPTVTEGHRLAFQAAALQFINSDNGPERLAKAIVDEAERCASGRVVIDGIRQRATLDALRRFASTRVAVLYVHTPPDVALRLYNARAGIDASMLQFAAIREAAVEAEVPGFLSISDAVLFNWEGRERYRELVDEFIQAPAAVVE